MKGNTRVLIVDDFDTLRLLLRNGIEKFGLEDIEEAVNGKQAWEMLQEAKNASAPFEIVFSDWSMPEMTGIQLIEAMKASVDFKNIPFVMVTSETDMASIELALKTGITDFIPKPYTPESLQLKLTSIFNRLGK
jgi:two-component system chemotaxis response regulator CheY